MARVLATMFVFSSARLLSRSSLVAFSNGLLFVLAPQILAIDLIRIDPIIVLLLATLMYLCLRLLDTGPSRWTLALIGVVSGALATTKITSVLFALVPAMALAMSPRTRSVPRVGLVVITFLSTAAVLSFRYLAFELFQPGLLYSSTVAKFGALKAWYAVLPLTPYFYYSYQDLLPYGALEFEVDLI